MFRLLKYIVLFLLGYKVIKLLFADNDPKKEVTKKPDPQNINLNNDPRNIPQQPDTRFSSAEPIEYEEVK